MPSDVLKLNAEMLLFTSSIEKLDTPDAVLDGLHKATHQATPLNVLGGPLLLCDGGTLAASKKARPSSSTRACLRDGGTNISN